MIDLKQEMINKELQNFKRKSNSIKMILHIAKMLREETKRNILKKSQN